MAITAGELSVLLTAKDQMSKVLKDVQGETEKTHANLSKLGSFLKGGLVVGAAAAGAAIAGTAAFLYSAGKAAAEEEVGILKLATAVNATGVSWDQVGGKVEAYVAAQQKRTAFDDSVVREGLQSMIQVTGSYEEAMNALPIVMDLARAKGMDLASAGQLVARALEGETGALTRYGIKLEEGATKEQVLAALQAKFAGQSEAYASTYMGKMELFQGQMGNLKETIGGLVLPIMTQLAGKFADLATNAIPIVEAAIVRLQPTFEAAVAFVGNVITALSGLVGTSGSVSDAVSQYWPMIQNVITSVIGVIQTAIQMALPIIEDVIIPAMERIWGYIQLAWPTIQAIIETVINGIFGTVSTVVRALEGFWEENHALIMQTATTIWAAIESIFNAVAGFLQLHGDWLIALFTTVWDVISSIVKTVLDVILGLVKVGMQLINGDFEGALETLKGIITNAWEGIKGIFSSALDLVKKTISEFNLADVGRALVDGLRGGIESAANSVADAARSIVQNAINAAKAALGIASPSKEFMSIGADIDRGLALGIEDYTAIPLEALQGMMNAITTLPALTKEDEGLTASLRRWGDRLRASVGIITGASDLAAAILKARDIMGQLTNSLEGLYAHVLDEYIPVIRGVLRAFKYHLPRLYDEGLDESLQLWADRLRASVGIITGAADVARAILDSMDVMGRISNSLEGLYAHIIDEYIPVIRGVLRAFKYELPRLYDEGLDESFQLWADRLASSIGIITGAASVADAVLNGMNVMGRISNNLLGLYAHIKDEYIPVIIGILRAFKYELPRLYDEGLDESFQLWADRLAAAIGVITNTSGLADAILNSMDIMGRISDNMLGLYAHIKDEYIPVIIGVLRAFKYELPRLYDEGLDESFGIWADRLGAAIGMITNAAGVAGAILDGMDTMGKITNNLEELKVYIQTEYVPVIRAVIHAFKYGLTKLFDESENKSLELYAGRLGSALEMITKTTDIGRALSELSWRKISQAQVENFVANLGNVIGWLQDKEKGLPSLQNLGDLESYAKPVQAAASMMLSLVDVFRGIGTLPQNIFPQARWDQLNIAIASLVTALKIAAQANIAPLFKIGASMGEAIIAGLNFALSSGGMALSPSMALPTGGGMTITHNVNVTVKMEGGMVIASDADRTSFARQITPAIMSELNRGGYGTSTDPNAWRPPHR